MDKKICLTCGTEKVLSGKRYVCKECKKKSDREYRLRNLEKLREYDRFRNKRDSEKRNKNRKEYYQKNKESISEKNKQWKIDNKEYYDLKKIEYRNNYREKKKIKDKEYRELNKEKIREYKRNWFNKKYNSDIEFNILFRLRRRVWIALKNSETKKNEPIKKILGCSVLELKQHLENQFKTGMSWSNYGEWEIDHIQPCSSFDLTNEQQQKECFHYTNLQPLWKTENRIKGARTA